MSKPLSKILQTQPVSMCKRCKLGANWFRRDAAPATSPPPPPSCSMTVHVNLEEAFSNQGKVFVFSALALTANFICGHGPDEAYGGVVVRPMCYRFQGRRGNYM